jgi:hypothetical protein
MYQQHSLNTPFDYINATREENKQYGVILSLFSLSLANNPKFIIKYILQYPWRYFKMVTSHRHDMLRQKYVGDDIVTQFLVLAV